MISSCWSATVETKQTLYSSILGLRWADRWESWRVSPGWWMHQCLHHIGRWEIKALKDWEKTTTQCMSLKRASCLWQKCAAHVCVAWDVSNTCLGLAFAVCPCIACMSMNPRAPAWLYFLLQRDRARRWPARAYFICECTERRMLCFSQKSQGEGHNYHLFEGPMALYKQYV